ncbi:MAG: hypothetical protein H7Z43_13850 [Clostridia bacterium]|nr:hypothetical protein [Deltaproteobacteria bacterium]
MASFDSGDITSYIVRINANPSKLLMPKEKYQMTLKGGDVVAGLDFFIASKYNEAL